MKILIFISFFWGLLGHAFNPQAAGEYAFSPQEKFHTNGLVIVREGKIVFQKFAPGHSFHTKHRLWSVSKSFTSLLLGVLIKEKIIGLESQVHDFFPSKQNLSINLGQLISMSSGLDWAETYEEDPFNSDVINMLYGDPHKDMASYVLDREQKYAPGTHFYYSSGDTNLLMAILKKRIIQLGKNPNTFPWEYLFEPLGIDSATWEQDLAGTFVGSSYLYMNMKDLLKIGRFLLDEKQNIIDPDYLIKSIQPIDSFWKTPLKNEKDRLAYGYGWWLNVDHPRKNWEAQYPLAPRDLVLGLGHHGQILAFSKSQNLFFIRLAKDKKGKFDKNRFMKILFGTAK